MAEILHQSIWRIYHYLQGFTYPRCLLEIMGGIYMNPEKNMGKCAMYTQWIRDGIREKPIPQVLRVFDFCWGTRDFVPRLMTTSGSGSRLLHSIRIPGGIFRCSFSSSLHHTGDGWNPAPVIMLMVQKCNLPYLWDMYIWQVDVFKQYMHIFCIYIFLHIKSDWPPKTKKWWDYPRFS